MTRFTLTRPEPLEAQIQRAVLQYLAHHPQVAWAERMNSGIFRPVRKDGSTGFVRAGFKGLSDVIGQMKDGRMLCVEVKRPSGRVTEAQDAFLALVRTYGGIAGVVRSVDDLEALLTFVPVSWPFTAEYA